MVSELQVDVKQFLVDFQDYLAPRLDTQEQAIYLYLVRHVRLNDGKPRAVPLKTARRRMALGTGQHGRPMSESTVSKKIRSLELKKAIRVLDVEHAGRVFQVFLPAEMGVVPSVEEGTDVVVDIETVNFFEKGNRVLILEREQRRCFYTLVQLDEANFVIDHVVPTSDGGGNSYRNVVACSRYANNRKGRA